MEMSKRTLMRFERLKKCAMVDNAMDDLTDIFNATLVDVLKYVEESGNTEISKQWLVYRVVWEVDTIMYGIDGRVFNSRKDSTAHGEADRLNAPLLLSIFRASRPLDEVWAILLAISGHQPAAGPKPAEKPAASRPVLAPTGPKLPVGSLPAPKAMTSHAIVSKTDFPTHAKGKMIRTYKLPYSISFKSALAPYRVQISKVLGVRLDSPRDDRVRITSHATEIRGPEDAALQGAAEVMLIRAHKHIVAFLKESRDSGRVPDFSAFVHKRNFEEVASVLSEPDWNQDINFGDVKPILPPRPSSDGSYSSYNESDRPRRERSGRSRSPARVKSEGSINFRVRDQTWDRRREETRGR